jgi:hypothetical protein
MQATGFNTFYGAMALYQGGSQVTNTAVLPAYFNSTTTVGGATGTGSAILTTTGSTTYTIGAWANDPFTCSASVDANGGSGVTWVQLTGGYVGATGPTGPTAFNVLNPATNRVLTATGTSSNTAQANSNLTFDGTTLGVTNRILTGIGSAALPSYSFTGSTGMGLYRIAPNALGISTLGTERIRVTEGLIGINTPGQGPGSRFQVNETTSNNNTYGYPTESVVINCPVPTSATALNDPAVMFYLVREGTAGQAFGPQVGFGLSRYENSSTNARTRMDIVMAHDDVLDDTRVMTLRSDGRMGLGTGTPSNRLDVVSDSLLDASIRTTTWTRTTGSNVYYGTYSSLSTNAIVWTQQTAINSNIMTVSANNGTYFVVKKAGIFSFTSIVYGSGTGTPVTQLDVSTGITHNTMASTTQLSSAIGASNTSLAVNWTGVLPASDTNYYKIKTNNYTGTNGRVMITYLGECPAITGFPY